MTHPAWALAIKRLADAAGAIVLLVPASPLLLLIAAAIKLTSPGPVLYRGVRSGLHGRPFRILKFRTMVTHAEQLGGPTTGTNDPRVTRVGRFLRRTKLDELPQLWNVLIGEMSFVGPRPEVLEYARLYTGEAAIINDMRPGITDYASIEFADLDDRVGSVDPDAYFRAHILPRKLELRIKYVREWSLRTDAALLAATARRVLQRVVSK